jgi:hypothetical protein
VSVITLRRGAGATFMGGLFEGVTFVAALIDTYKQNLLVNERRRSTSHKNYGDEHAARLSTRTTNTREILSSSKQKA